MALGTDHFSNVEGIFASERGADHMRAKSRTIVTFLHEYLRLSSWRVHSGDVYGTEASSWWEW